MLTKTFWVSVVIGITGLFLFHKNLSAQNSDYSDLHEQYDLFYRTFRVTLVPGLGTNGVDATRFASKYSWNILGGYNGALDGGFELGGLINANKYYAHGNQIAGIGNYSGAETGGVQLAGVFNYAAEEMQGIQISGAANISKRDLQGIQFTGGLNWSGGSAQGVQASGLATVARDNMQGLFFSGAGNITPGFMQGIAVSGLLNYAGREMQGIMASGLLNYSEYFQGIAAGSVNISREAQGIQIGVLNMAERIEGVQIGIINYGRDMKGMPVGLISYYINGRKNIDVWTSDAGFLNTGIKLGTNEIYNMISIGYNPALGRDVWQVGWSIGHLREYETHSLYTDFSIFKINEGGWTKDLNNVYKYRLLFGKEFAGGLHLYGGPTFNMLVSRIPGSSDYTWYRLLDFGAKGRDYIFWIGYSLGIELF